MVLVLISFKFHKCSCVMKAPLAFSIIILISLLVFPYYDKSSEDGWTWPDHFNPNVFFTVKLHSELIVKLHSDFIVKLYSDFIAKLHSDCIVKQVYFVSIFSKILAHTPCGGCIDKSLVLFRFGKYFITWDWYVKILLSAKHNEQVNYAYKNPVTVSFKICWKYSDLYSRQEPIIK